ncbi:Xaa-Pro aminopeptidase [Streptomyces agglomeratus]|nr:Xaa-Pro aminopeptidase [Streptomyces agglomeratus]OEJ36830.1 Xaa-Pro aminopeptidase [Streptomyces agglomeratus]OEJ42002.1 Xaa-Pro aminopeptidase [Streptomyces agglomeratus]OEJ43618.1 Xaa-Pro aminopeptidase [Streptomyces agglomeratus]OEJ61862.1 Xaa-Pro aminopeptidase [Streptomyces agglomeratus]
MTDSLQEAVVTDESDENKARKNGLYGGVSTELAENMKQGWADTERRDLQPIAQAAHTARRRAALSAQFPDELLVIPSGNPKVRSNDTDYPFRPSSDYVYLTGDQSQDAVLVLEPGQDGGHRAVAYLLPRSDYGSGEFWLDYHGELWDGRRNSLTENEQLLGLPCRDVRTLTERLAAATGPIRLLRGYDAAVDAALNDKVTAERDTEFRVALSEMRLVKDDFEIADLRHACQATARGFEDVVRVLGTDTPTLERAIEGTFYMRARIEGNDVGYASVCAAGPHATTLHWVRNDGETRPGELLLIDAGVESRNLYTADVTRTLPVDGRFTPVQRKVYDAVYEAQSAGIAAVGPGAKYRDFHHAAQRVLAEHLAAWGLFGDRSVDEAYELGLHRRWTLAGTGHMIGLDVHDCAKARTELYVDGTLEAGMVLTVEPGLYFQSDDLTVPEELRGIGIRIEDDILVTEEGNENLSGGLPRAADDVETWMANLRG